MQVTDFGIGLLVLACVFGGALTGMFLGRVLPAHHLGDDTKSVVTLALGTLSILSALVIGLLISYAKDRPFEGLITVSPEPMRTALAHMGS